MNEAGMLWLSGVYIGVLLAIGLDVLIERTLCPKKDVP